MNSPLSLASEFDPDSIRETSESVILPTHSPLTTLGPQTDFRYHEVDLQESTAYTQIIRGLNFRGFHGPGVSGAIVYKLYTPHFENSPNSRTVMRCTIFIVKYIMSVFMIS